MMRDLNCSHELAVMGLAGFPLGFGLGPLALAPFSETYGRHRVYIASSILFTIFLIPVARAQNISTVIVFRVFMGIAGSSGSTLVGGTIADMFTDKDRGLALGIFSVCSLSGTGLGPMVSGWVGMAWGWRGIEYVQLVFAGVLSILIATFTRETRGSVLLSRRAAKLRKETGDNKYQCRSDAERASLAIMVKTSMTRPLCKLSFHDVTSWFLFFPRLGRFHLRCLAAPCPPPRPPQRHTTLTLRSPLRRLALYRACRRCLLPLYRFRVGHHLPVFERRSSGYARRVRVQPRPVGLNLRGHHHRRHHRRDYQPLPGAPLRQERRQAWT
jgi:multidrug resistance protein